MNQDPAFLGFERLVRAYVAGEASWDAVHKYAIEMEWAGATNFPPQLRNPLEALHTAFLTADERDDPQFRLDRSEVAHPLRDLDDAWAQHGRT